MAWWTSSLPTGACVGEGGSAIVHQEQQRCRMLVSPGEYWCFPSSPSSAIFFQHGIWRSDHAGGQVGLGGWSDQSRTQIGLYLMVLLHYHPVFLAGGDCSSLWGHQSLRAFLFSSLFFSFHSCIRSVFLIHIPMKTNQRIPIC